MIQPASLKCVPRAVGIAAAMAIIGVFAAAGSGARAEGIGVQSELLRPGKSELVKYLEAIFYNGDFASIPGRDFSAADHGAVGDGRTLNTGAIQKTIDAAAAAGGGRVIFQAGNYVSGALFLKSNVELHLGEGVRIQAIQDDAHFPDIQTRIAGVEMPWPAALINIYEEQNVKISGKGTIDGNGKYWWDKFWGDPVRTGGMYVDYDKRGLRWAVDYDCKRVRALAVYEAREVKLQDFTIERSGFWAVSLTYSDQVHVDGIVIRNNIGGFGPSSDGINTDSSRNILVENCDIDCNDDNLCLKAGKDADGLRVNRPTERVVYRNCITRSGHGLFTLGSETSGGIHDVEVYGLKAVGTDTGIRFKSAKVRGGEIRDIWFHDIEMIDVAQPFHFELNWYPSYSYPTIPDNIPKSEYKPHWITMTIPVEPPERGIPNFHNMTLSNISVKGGGKAIYVNAYPEKPMQGMRWENIAIEAKEGGKMTCAKDWVMNNVTLMTPNGGAIEQSQCENVQLPRTLAIGEGGGQDSFKPEDRPHVLGM
jgi:polygalacturonase